MMKLAFIHTNITQSKSSSKGTAVGHLGRNSPWSAFIDFISAT